MKGNEHGGMTVADGPIEELEISVRADRCFQNPGVKTVGEVRKIVERGGLASVGLGAKRHEKSIREALAAWDKAREAKHVEVIRAARRAFMACTPAERAMIFRERLCTPFPPPEYAAHNLIAAAYLSPA